MPATLQLKTLSVAAAAQEKSDLLVLLLPGSETKAALEGAAEDTTENGSQSLQSLLAQAISAGDFDSDKAGSSLALYSVAQVASRKVLLVGLGEATQTDAGKAMSTVLAALRQDSIKKAIVHVAGDTLAEPVLYAIAQGLAGAGYRYTATKPGEKPLALQKVTLGVEGKADKKLAERANGIAAGIAMARELGNLPANIATPSYLAQTAQTIGKAANISIKVHGPREIQRLKMGAFMAVAQGSEEPPQFIELHYQGGAKNDAPVVLVGKGVTFDTGGISIKPSAAMDEMKFDMCGAASVLGVFEALASLQPAINVVGLIPSTENMPDGRAIKPGDVVTSMSGKTIEILNTDAEGRLILCDALSYADRFKPRAVIDIATLTGACVVALGGVRSGLFASEDALARELLDAGQACNDLAWRMPLDDDYRESLKSNFADIANVGGREGGAVTAAKFLQQFTGDWPWAHLDIAGTAWKSGSAKGATGRPVALLMHYLLQQSGEPGSAGAPQKEPARKTRAAK